MLEIIIYSFLIMAASLSGVFSIWKTAGNFVEKNLHYLISFSSGVFLVVAYQLITETIHHSSSVSYAVTWVLVGMIFIWLVFKIKPNLHHHHEEDCHHKNENIDARKIITADAIHNVGDGILLAVSFTISSFAGISIAISIFIHELIQEISEFFILRQAGYSIKKSLKLNFLSSSTILIGSIGGFLLIDFFKVLEIPLLGIAAGSIVIILIQDLIPHSIRDSISNKHVVKHIIWFLIGIFIMFNINILLGHGHDLDHEDHEYGDEHIIESLDHEEDYN